MAAFHAAAAQGATWVELDVRRTGDGGLVVRHDPVDARGVPLIDQSLDALAAQGYLELGAALDALPAGLGVDIELKNLYGEPDFDEEQHLAGLVAAAVAPRLGSRPLLASSFNPHTLAALRAGSADIPLGLLLVPLVGMELGIQLALDYGVEAVFAHVTAPDLTAQAFAQAHAAGLQVMVWTVDDLTQAVFLAAAGVDALCTNDPAGVLAAVRSPQPNTGDEGS